MRPAAVSPQRTAPQLRPSGCATELMFDFTSRDLMTYDTTKLLKHTTFPGQIVARTEVPQLKVINNVGNGRNISADG